MDTRKIRVLLSAIEHKSLSKAAEEVSYTPSAMSHITDSVEKELGVKLLDRTPLGIALTKDGEELYGYMVELAEAEKRLLSAASSIAKAKEKHLRIGTFSSISQTILPEVIGKFKSEHPEIKISMSVEDSLHDWLEKDLADIIFTDDVSYGDNVWLPIGEDPFVAVVPSDMLPGKKKVTKEELYLFTYISTNEKILDSYFEKNKFKNVLDFESVDNMSVLYMIKEGVGFSVLPRLMLEKRIGGIKMLKLDEPISRTIGFAYKRKANQSYAARTFIEYLLNIKR